MTSAIDPNVPPEGAAYTADVRANFATAASEITALQATVATLQTQVGVLNSREAAAVQLITPNPPNTNSAVFVVSGAETQFTTGTNTRAIFMVSGQLGNAGNGNQSEAQLVYGEGTKPDPGTLLTATNGVLLGVPVDMLAAKSNDTTPFTLTVLLEALTRLQPGTVYWFGAALRAISGTATLGAMSVTVFELLDPVS